MTISGVALLAICMLAGNYLGDLLGIALGVKANVGGVGIAMILLISARIYLVKNDLFSPGLKKGVEMWGSLYIPIVVAMAASQNVVAAVKAGPFVLMGGAGAVVLCFCTVALISRIGPHGETMDEIEAREAAEAAAAEQAKGEAA